jgi:hypothetical protein
MLAICVCLFDSLVFNCNCVFLKPLLILVWHLLIIHINYSFGFQSRVIVHHVWVVFVVVIKLMHYGLSITHAMTPCSCHQTLLFVVDCLHAIVSVGRYFC